MLKKLVIILLTVILPLQTLTILILWNTVSVTAVLHVPLICCTSNNLNLRSNLSGLLILLGNFPNNNYNVADESDVFFNLTNN